MEVQWSWASVFVPGLRAHPAGMCGFGGRECAKGEAPREDVCVQGCPPASPGQSARRVPLELQQERRRLDIKGDHTPHIGGWYLAKESLPLASLKNTAASRTCE